MPEYSSTICSGIDGVSIENLPLQDLPSGYVRIETLYSCVSAGTELSSFSNSKKSLLSRALSHPDQVNQVLRTFRDRGVRRTYSAIQEKKSAFSPLGYSCVGRVVENTSSSPYKLGDIVACAGVSYASHGTINTVPESLCSTVPANCDLRTASTVALGSIALHAFRRTGSTIGSNILVVGLGPLGILACEIALAAGCNVVGFDISSKRVDLASQLIPDAVFYNTLAPSFASITSDLESFFDSAIIAASSNASSMIDVTTRHLAKKGKLIILGDVPIVASRESIYRKEIDILISTSYGPGRYDTEFEEANIKYPLEYIRWTESENFKVFLDLIAAGHVKSIKGSFHEISQSEYIQTLESPPSSLFLLIKYPAVLSAPNSVSDLNTPAEPHSSINSSFPLYVDFIGLSGYTKSMILPYLKPLSRKYNLLINSCYSSSPSNAASFAKHHRVVPFSSLDQLFSSSPKNAKKLAIIASSHADHFSQVIECLHHDYIVYCEKPLCLDQAQLDSITSCIKSPTVPGSYILVGYNRRFSPHSIKAKQFALDKNSGRLSGTRITYTVNVKAINSHQWLLNPKQGTRNVGETCHMYDFCNFFFDTTPNTVEVLTLTEDRPIDNFVVVLRYPHDNVAVITYACVSGLDYPKELIDIKSPNSHLSIVDFCRTDFRSAQGSRNFRTKRIDKGQQNMWLSYLEALHTCSPPPISYEHIYSASQISFIVDKRLT